MVAVTPQIASKSVELTEKHKLQFDMLSDAGNEYGAKLGIRFTVHPDLQAVYKGFGNNLPDTNGDESWTLPIPCRLVIDQQGVIKNADVGLDYTHRPEPQKTLDDVRALVGG
jgi:peroxiredoxin